VRHLLLIRHARAESTPGPDHNRALTPDGRRDASRLGPRVSPHVAPPAIAVVSTATRARQTWDEIADALPGVDVLYSPGLYGAVDGAAAVIDAIRHVDDSFSTVLVVAHNPGLEEVMVMCSGAESLGRTTLPTASRVLVETDGPWGIFAPSSARAVDVTVARDQE
jgi:phosphohistidine phosphatase